jgi:hypothetical protein
MRAEKKNKAVPTALAILCHNIESGARFCRNFRRHSGAMRRIEPGIPGVVLPTTPE